MKILNLVLVSLRSCHCHIHLVFLIDCYQAQASPWAAPATWRACPSPTPPTAGTGQPSAGKLIHQPWARLQWKLNCWLGDFWVCLTKLMWIFELLLLMLNNMDSLQGDAELGWIISLYTRQDRTRLTKS